MPLPRSRHQTVLAKYLLIFSFASKSELQYVHKNNSSHTNKHQSIYHICISSISPTSCYKCSSHASKYSPMNIAKPSLSFDIIIFPSRSFDEDTHKKDNPTSNAYYYPTYYSNGSPFSDLVRIESKTADFLDKRKIDCC